ncbi:MAG: acyl-CoA dehydrogenase family protein [Roseomonas sp.]|nr:acyl-CoA dehydrogenase family protein [Roseomonas sp.]MCA3343785.1 acyl-CoA dehydrogenase family protein [Roseomonas sp.]
MDFDLSEDQRLLQDSLTKLLADKYKFEDRKRYLKSATGWSQEMWEAYAELGLLGLPFAEEDGGFGAGPVEVMLMAEAMGSAITLEPWLATVVMGGGFIRHGASTAQRAAMVPDIAAGKLKLAFGYTEPQSRHDLHDVATTAKKDGAGWVLEGRKGVVLHGDVADHIIVTARTGGARRDKSGIGVFLVPANAKGVTRRGYPTTDSLRGAEITLDRVSLPAEALLGDAGNGLALVDRVVDETIAALAGEALGAMDALQKLTLDYLKTRKQFGRPIGTFQSLQHRAAEMMVSLEEARSMAMLAAMMAQEPDALERRRQMSAVKVQIGRSGKFIGQSAIQLHGGIAMTMEYLGGHYFKRLTTIDTMFGDADHHVTQLMAMGGLNQAA